MFTYRIGDARNELEQVQGIRTTVTDPPYNLGFDYGPVSDSLSWGEYRNLIVTVLEKSYKATVEGGSFFLIHYPKTIADLWEYFPQEWLFHQWLTWCYPANFGHSTRKFTKASRAILWLAKGEPLFIPNAVEQPYKNPNDRRIRALIESGKTGTNHYDWWEINLCKNVSKDKHGYSNQIPEELLRRVILSTTNPGELVSDPFAGTFSTVATAVKLGRQGWGCDLNPQTEAFAKAHMLRLP